MLRMSSLRATCSAADFAQASAPCETDGARRDWPLSGARPGEAPAHRAVAQRHDLVGHARVDQRLRADDRARAPRAVDHHQRVRLRRHVVHAQHQLGARHVDAGRDRDALEFIEGPAVEHHHVGARLHQRVELVRRDARRAVLVLDQLAERLARHVDAGEQLVAGRLPADIAAVEHADIDVAGFRQHGRGALRQPVGIVDQHDPRRTAWDQPRHAQLEPAQRHRAREQQVVLRKDPLLAHVEQRELLPIEQHRAQRPRADAAHLSGHQVACCGVIWCTSPVFRSKRTRLILSRLVPVTRMKRARSG